MKKVALILSSSLRSEIYYKKIKKNNIFISKIIYYGKKKSFIKKHDLKKVTFFSCDHLDNKICKFIIKQKEKEFIISPKPGELIKNKALLKKKIDTLPSWKSSILQRKYSFILYTSQ